MEGSALNNLGNTYFHVKEYQQTIDYCQRSLEIAQKLNDKKLEADSLLNIGVAWMHIEKPLKAKLAHEKAKRIFQTISLDKYVEECDRRIQSLE